MWIVKGMRDYGQLILTSVYFYILAQSFRMIFILCSLHGKALEYRHFTIIAEFNRPLKPEK